MRSKTAKLICSFIILSSLMLLQEAYAQLPKATFTLTNPADDFVETMIVFKHSATDGYDPQYDQPVAPGDFNIALYSIIDTKAYSVQYLSNLTDDKSVLFGLDAPLAGMHRLRLDNTEGMDESAVIIVEDLDEGVKRSFRLDTDYWFHQDSAANVQRFIIHFYPALELTTANGSCDGAPSLLQINQQGTQQWDYEIRNQNNSIIASGNSWNGVKALANIPTGNYSISLTDNYGYSVLKQAFVEDKESVTAQFQVSDSVASVNKPVYFFDYSVGASDYIWDFGDGEVLTGTPFPQKIFSSPGVYRVMFTAINNECNDISEKIIEVVDVPTGISEFNVNKPEIYSFGKSIYFDYTKNLGIARIEIYNLLGQNIYHQNLPAPGKHHVSLPDHNGYALVKVFISGKTFSAKVYLQ